MSELAFPLSWPSAWPRTNDYQRQADKFKVSFAVAREELLQELRLLKAVDSVLSSNIPLRQDGLPYAKFTRPADPGFAVYFTRRNQRFCVPCDSWIEPVGNLRAIGLSIQAIRGLERWGAGGMVSAALDGFKALMPSAESVNEWWRILGVEPDAPRAEIDARYRELIKKAHPDMGGSDDAFIAVNKAWEESLRG